MCGRWPPRTLLVGLAASVLALGLLQYLSWSSSLAGFAFTAVPSRHGSDDASGEIVLERASSDQMASGIESLHMKIAKLAEAQASGIESLHMKIATVAEAQAAKEAETVRERTGLASLQTSASICEVVKILFARRPVGEKQLETIINHQLPRHNGPYYPTRADLMEILYSSASPYHGMTKRDMSWLKYSSTAVDQGGKLREFIIRTLGSPPKFMVEVGSFVGMSAIKTWGPMVSSGGGILLCVDTWQGDINMRLGKQFKQMMQFEHGFPMLHRIFLDHVVAAGLTDTIFPLAMPSIVAARLLAVVDWRIDAVFVDSAHEQGETFVELHLYWQLLRPGGVLFGDDYTLFPAVRHDVREFAKCHGVVPIVSIKNIWIIVKPGS